MNYWRIRQRIVSVLSMYSVGVIALVPIALQAATVQVDARTLRDGADTIVDAVVLSKNSKTIEWDYSEQRDGSGLSDLVVTYVEVEVQETFKGDYQSGDVAVIVVPGGMAPDGRAIHYSHVYMPKVDERLLLFLSNKGYVEKSQALRVFGGSQGVWRLDRSDPKEIHSSQGTDAIWKSDPDLEGFSPGTYTSQSLRDWLRRNSSS